MYKPNEVNFYFYHDQNKLKLLHNVNGQTLKSAGFDEYFNKLTVLIYTFVRLLR